MLIQNINPQTPGNFLGKPLISAATFTIDLDRPYLVKNLLLGSQVSLLVGPPNIGKSSVIACLAASISMGRALGETRVKRSTVLYVAAEDPNGIAERAYGYFQAQPSDLAHFYIHAWPVNLADDEEMRNFLTHGLRLRDATNADRMLIVFDTLNLCIGDGDENSARDMSRVIGNAQRLAQATGAHVMIIHHTSVADAGRPRGSTAMHGNVDTLLVLRKIEGDDGRSLVALYQEKQRSVRKGKPLVFEIGSLDAGRDEDGEMITVPIARPVSVSSTLLARPADGRSAANDSDERAAEVLRVLRELQIQYPTQFYEAKDIGGMVGGSFEKVRGNPDSLRKAVRRAIDTVLDTGKIEGGPGGGFRAIHAGSLQTTAAG